MASMVVAPAKGLAIHTSILSSALFNWFRIYLYRKKLSILSSAPVSDAGAITLVTHPEYGFARTGSSTLCRLLSLLARVLDAEFRLDFFCDTKSSGINGNLTAVFSVRRTMIRLPVGME